MQKSTFLLSLAATTLGGLVVVQGAMAQAPIERHYRSAPTTTFPTQGVRVVAGPGLETVSATAAQTELRLTRGMATVYIDHPSDDALILIDLPGGQADLVRDGVYTLNADNNTLTVLRGEADVFPAGAPADAKGTTTKEGQQVTLGPNAKPIYTSEARGDGGGRYYGGSYGNAYYGNAYYGGGYYGDGYAPAYYGWDYPYTYGYGYGWGYPAFGLGFGYGGWGGWGYGGGFGGYRGGFGGGGFRGRR